MSDAQALAYSSEYKAHTMLTLSTKTIIASITVPGSGSPYASVYSLLSANVKAALVGPKRQVIAAKITVGSTAINVQDTYLQDGTEAWSASTAYDLPGFDCLTGTQVQSSGAGTVACQVRIYTRPPGKL